DRTRRQRGVSGMAIGLIVGGAALGLVLVVVVVVGVVVNAGGQGAPVAVGKGDPAPIVQGKGGPGGGVRGDAKPPKADGQRPAPELMPVLDPDLKAIGEGKFAKPAAVAAPVSYLQAISTPGDTIGQGKTYMYSGQELNVERETAGVRVGVTIRAGGW